MIYTISEIRDLITPVAKKHNLKAVYLFGSYARGTATENSDIDLLIDTSGTSIQTFFDLGAVYCDLEDALQWLEDAGLVIKTELVEKPELPLDGFADKTYFKVYMSDIGLLRAKSRVSVQTIMNESDLYVRYKGAFAENYVLCELVSTGKKPYFWRSGNSAEVDFIYESEGKLVPVEVKAADNTQAKSYKQFCRKYSPNAGIKMSEKNIAENMCVNTVTFSLPLYLGWNIDRYVFSH